MADVSEWDVAYRFLTLWSQLCIDVAMRKAHNKVLWAIGSCGRCIFNHVMDIVSFGKSEVVGVPRKSLLSSIVICVDIE